MINQQQDRSMDGSGLRLSFFAVLGIVVGTWIVQVLSLPDKWAFTLLGAFALASSIWITRKVEYYLLLLIVVAVPLNLDVNFFVIEGHTAGVNSISFGLVDIILIILWMIFLWCRLIRDRGKIEWYSKITIPFGALIALEALTTLRAQSPQLSLFEIILLLRGLLIFLYLANAVMTEDQLRLIIFGIGAGVLIESVFGMLQHFSGSSIGLGILGESDQMWEQDVASTVFQRIGGTIGYTNDYAKYLSFYFPIGFSLLFAPLRRAERFFYLLTLFALVPAVTATLCRAAWLGIGISSAVVMACNIKRKGVSLWPAVLGLLIVMGIAFTQIDLIKLRFISDDNGSTYSRVSTARVALKVIADYPLLGVGANNYDMIVPKYGDVNNPWTFHAAVHNMYLLHTAETGLVGLLVFIWLSVSVLLQIRKSVKVSPSFSRSFAVGVYGALFALIFQGFADFGVKQNEPRFIFLWMAIGAVVAAANFKPCNTQ